MALYPYRSQLVVDPDNPRNVVAGGSVSIYDSEDTARTTLLALTDPNGVPIPNPFTSYANGLTPAFVTTSPEVLWVSGSYTDYFQSYKGMRDEAAAAREAAETAAAGAASAAQADLEARIASGVFKGEPGQDGANVLPTDAAIKQAIDNPASATRGALTTTIQGAVPPIVAAEAETQVPPLVAAAIAADGTVANAAAAAVDGALGVAGVFHDAYPSLDESAAVSFVDKYNRRAWVEIDKTGGMTEHTRSAVRGAALEGVIVPEDLPSSSGAVVSFTDASGRASDLTLGTDGQLHEDVIKRLAPRIQAAKTKGVLVEDSITEWWVGNQAVTLTEPYTRVLGATVGGKDGSVPADADYLLQRSTIWVWEWTPTLGTKQVKVGTAVTDDHSAPGIWAGNGRRALVVWQSHGQTTKLHCAVSDQSGSLDSFAMNPGFEIETGYEVSYEQIHRIEHLCDATQDTFYIFYRSGSNRPPFTQGVPWAVQKISLNQATGAITDLGNTMFWAGGDRAPYVSSADAHNAAGNQVIRMAWGHNPQEPAAHEINYLELDVVTGAFTSPGNPGLNANLNGTGLPIVETALTPAIPNPPAGWSRRLFYVRPGPIAPAIAYGDYELAAGAATMEYKVSVLDRATNTWSTRTFGVAGKMLGFHESYVAGVAFPNPCYNDVLHVTREAAGISTVEEHTLTRGVPESKVLASSISTRYARPFTPLHGSPLGILYCDISYYDPLSYRDFRSQIRSTETGA